MNNILALIPARGGSKRIPDKNIKLLGAHPLLAYSVAAGLQAARVSRVIVTTDSPTIADIGRAYGAEVPFLRPSAISQDASTDLEAFHHALGWLAENENYRPDIVVHLRPTIPFRPPNLVDEAIEQLVNHPHAHSIRTLVPFSLTPYKMWRKVADGFIQPVAELPGLPEAHNFPAQQLPTTYLHSGHVDVMCWSVIMEQRSMTGQNVLPLFVDPHYTVDIDVPEDWQQAENLLKTLQLPYITPDERKP